MLLVIALSLGLFAFTTNFKAKGDPEKDKMLLELLTFVIERGHYDPAAIDDKFSKGIYKDSQAGKLKIFISINILNFLLYNPVLGCSGEFPEHT